MEKPSESLASELTQCRATCILILIVRLWCDSGLVGGDATLRFKTHSALPELQSELLNNTGVEAN